MMRSLSCAAVVLLVWGLDARPARAHGEASSGQIRDVANRIAGGATLLVDIERNTKTEAFHEAAHHFESRVEEGSADARHVASDWRALKKTFGRIRHYRSRDERFAFLVAHLDEDIEAGDRVLGPGAGASEDEIAPGRYGFIDEETCVGVNRVGKRPCPERQAEVRFRIPSDVRVIHAIAGEWRDYGRRTRAQVYLNDRLVWETGVDESWDGDRRVLDLPVPKHSTLRVASSNGDPVWIRRLEIESGESQRGDENPLRSIFPWLDR